MKKRYLLLLLLNLFFINAAFSQGSTCATAQPFCAGGSALTFPNTTGVPSPGNLSCLGSTPNPAWFYLQIDDPGTLNFLISQTDLGGTPRDVDFIAWGPFAAPTCLPANLTPANEVGCSYSGSATETFDIFNALPGQIYMIMLTNFSNQPGNITLEQTNSTAPIVTPGVGSTNCDIVCPLSITGGNVSTCAGTTLTAVYLNSTLPTFQWYLDTGSGPVLIAGATGTTYVPTVAGTYSIIANSPGCSANQPASTVIFNPTPVPIQPPNNLTLCTPGSTLFNLASNTAVILTGLTASDYDVNYHTTLVGAQNVDGSIPNPNAYAGLNGQTIYISIQDLPNGGCVTTSSFTLNFSSCGLTPVPPPDLSVCDDISNDGLATFDLTQQDITILGTYTPAANYNITYHLSLLDAQNDVAPISPANAYIGSNTQTIYVRLEEVATPTTYGTTDFQLFVNPLPTITGTLTVCSGLQTQLTGSATPAVTNAWVSSNTGVATVDGTGLVTGVTAGTTTITYTTSDGCVTTADVTVNTSPTIIGTLSVCEGLQTQLTGSAAPAAVNPWVSSNTAVATVDATGLVTGVSSGTSTITYTNSNGCIITAIVTVNALPTITGTLSVCEGLQTQLTGSATAAAVNAWISSNTAVATVDATGLVTGVLSGTSIITYTNSNGCIITANITVNSLPTISGTLVVCSGLQTQLTGSATPAAVNAWVSSNTAVATIDATGLVTGVSSGTTTITYTNSNGCIITAIVTVNALPTITGTLSVCEGLQTQLTGSAAPAAVNPWISLNTAVATVDATGLVTGVSSGTSTITYTNSNGCIITAIVTVNALPTITGTLFVCEGLQTQLTGSAIPAAINAWVSSNTAVATIDATGLVTGVSSGTTTITYTNSNGCVITAIVTVNALPTITGALSVCEGSQTQLTGSVAPAAVNAWVSSNTAVATVDATGLVTGVSSGTSTITYINSNGCIITATVTVNPLPTATISGTTTVCSGSGTNILFNGTPNAIVTYTIDAGGNLTTTLDGTGASTVATGNLTVQTVYNLVSVSTSTGVPLCSQNQNGSATVSVVTLPVITNPTPLQVCDNNNDGFANFILSTKDNEITGGQPNLVVTYYETATDAQNGVSPITQNPYPNIVSGIQTIYVRVSDIAAPQCASFTTLQLIVNPRPIPNPVITDYALCDTNNPGDGIEGFDLPTKSLEILNGQTGSTVTYYVTQLDAQNETSPIDTTVLYMSTSQQIWIRLENNTTGCFSVSSFQLVVNPLPTVVAPNPMNGCSNGVTNTAEFNLSLNDSTISGGVANVTVTYYLTLSEAQNEANALAIPYTSSPRTVYVRVENATTGCYDTTSLVLNVTQGPVANTPTPLEVCDPNSDGFSAFNLESASNEISGGSVPAGVVITYHETAIDAQNGTNALTSPYTNIVVNTQPIYVRVSYALTGCSNFVMLQLIVHSTPVATEIPALEECDDNADGIASFDLTTATAGILGSLNPAQHTVSYYVLQADAQSGTNPISNVLNYVNVTPNTQTIWVTVMNNATGCFDVVPLQLIVNPLPIVPFPVPSYSLCDYNNPGDEKEQFDLSTKIPEIVGLQTGLVVTFHFYAADATAGINPLPNLYINDSTAQTLHVRVENAATNCFVVTTMDIRVEPLPSPMAPPAPITECDVNGDGIAVFNLAALESGILNGASPITTVITFHETLQDANGGNNDLTSPYTNIVSFVQFVYVRAENTLTGCYSVIMIELNVNPSPVIPPSTVLQDLTKCDADNNNQNGLTTFDLTVQNPILLAAQPGPAGNYSIAYYTSQTDAQAGTAPIIPPNSYPSISNPQTIWVRVNNTVTGCSSIGTFQLIVGVPLALTTPTPLSLCDDGPTTPIPTRVFDLTVKNNEILGSATGYTVTYFPSYADALAGTNVITNPTAYTNTANAQTLGVMVTSPAGCKSYTTMDIRVLPLPTALTTPPELAQCDATAPTGTELFDLTTNEAYIANGDPNLTFEYYLSPAAADTQTGAIATPTAYETGTRIIYIRVMNNQVNFSGSNCYVLVPQSVRVNPLPVVMTNPTYTICDTAIPATNTATFTLSEMNDDLLLGTAQNVSDFAITYYLTPADAQAGTNALLNSYQNISNPQTIYPRIVNNLTGCVNFTAEVTLVVAAGATATNPVPLATCDTDFTTANGTYTFDLTQLDTEVLGLLQASPAFTVAYFASPAEAATGLNPITNPNAYPTATGTLYAVVTNTATLCRSDPATVSITVEPLAEPVINSTTGSDTICVEWGTDVLLSGLTLDSGITDPNYTFQWSLDGQPITVNGTNSTYVIDAATPAPWAGNYTVIATSTSTLACPSVPSGVFPVIQSGPAVALGSGYTISNAFAENQVITVTVQGHSSDYHYQLDNGPILDNGGVFENVGPGVHTVQVYDMEGNTSCDPFQINDIQTINYPTYFTPNGDGIHDDWNIIGLSSQSNAKIYIFDRYGKLIKQISTTSRGWDGTYNGQPLFSTDYWFTVEYVEAGANKIFKAHFSLKR